LLIAGCTVAAWRPPRRRVPKCRELTNVANYAHATQASVRVEVIDGTFVVEVADDGVAGASEDRGSGLRGLADRVEALDATLRIWSRSGAEHASGVRSRAGDGRHA
jgi:glucose-6-phosphate-specific signal transduction histidine kinase